MEQQPEAARVVVVGAGQAGMHVCFALRRHGFGGAIVLVGEEAHAPYQRPPLSKAFLKGEMDAKRLLLKPEHAYAESAIDWRPGEVAVAIDRDVRQVRLRSGEALDYDRLVLATGSRPRALPAPGAALGGVLALRGIDDTLRLRERLADCRALIVVGGGYIGLEVAATARAKGIATTILERADRLLARVTSPIMSGFVRDLHARHGVTVMCNADIAELCGTEGRVTGVRLADGRVIAGDTVVVGIGVDANQELAAEAGLPCDAGILVDGDARTADPLIYAIGDCTRHPVEGYGGAHRVESVHNALDQAERAARHLLGLDPPPFDPPWFWSDQYDAKLQTVGLLDGFDDQLVHGDPASGRIAVLYFAQERLIAVDAVSDPASFMAARQLLKRPGSVMLAECRDRSLKELLAERKEGEKVP
jgi:3-phenylpropionate/trans-cinnamate dioxygenase ferredoxin reductase subunit